MTVSATIERSFINGAIRSAMQQSRMSETQLAAAVGVTAQAVRKWTADQSTPSGEIVLLLLAQLPHFRDAVRPLLDRRLAELRGF